MGNSGAFPRIAVAISKSSAKAAEYFYHTHLKDMGTSEMKIVKVHGAHIGKRLKGKMSSQALALLCTYHAMQLATRVLTATDDAARATALARVDLWNERGIEIFHDEDVAECMETLGAAGLLEGERWRELLAEFECDATTHATHVAALKKMAGK